MSYANGIFSLAILILLDIYIYKIYTTLQPYFITETNRSAFKKRAPKAIKAIKEFARKTMGTKDVRLDPKLNEQVWSKGVKTVQHRIRVLLERKRNDDDEAAEKLYTYVSVVQVASFKGLQTTVVEQ